MTCLSSHRERLTGLYSSLPGLKHCVAGPSREDSSSLAVLSAASCPPPLFADWSVSSRSPIVAFILEVLLHFIFSAFKYDHLFFVCVASEVVAPVQMRLNVPFLADGSETHWNGWWTQALHFLWEAHDDRSSCWCWGEEWRGHVVCMSGEDDYQVFPWNHVSWPTAEGPCCWAKGIPVIDQGQLERGCIEDANLSSLSLGVLGHMFLLSGTPPETQSKGSSNHRLMSL